MMAHDRHAAREALQDRARGALLGLALGDALGASVEFMTPREIRLQYGCHEQIRGGGWLRLPPGHVTDDTTMMLALAQAWLDCAEPTAADYARAFDAWMRARPVDVGHTVRRGIIHYRRTQQPCVPASEDAGNGAAMRCAPIALVLLGAPPGQVHAATLAQAHVTHHNPLSDAATLAIVDMLQAALGGAGIGGMMTVAHALVRREPRFRFRGRVAGNPSAYIVDTLRTVLQAVDLNDNFRAALVQVVNRGGDADTTGAITGTLMGALCGAAALPAPWLRALDARILSRCVTSADALIARAPAWRH